MQKLIAHLMLLEAAREEAFAEGNWDRVDLLQCCIDDTKNAIAKLS